MGMWILLSLLTFGSNSHDSAQIIKDLMQELGRCPEVRDVFERAAIGMPQSSSKDSKDRPFIWTMDRGSEAVLSSKHQADTKHLVWTTRVYNPNDRDWSDPNGHIIAGIKKRLPLENKRGRDKLRALLKQAEALRPKLNSKGYTNLILYPSDWETRVLNPLWESEDVYQKRRMAELRSLRAEIEQLRTQQIEAWLKEQTSPPRKATKDEFSALFGVAKKATIPKSGLSSKMGPEDTPEIRAKIEKMRELEASLLRSLPHRDIKNPIISLEQPSPRFEILYEDGKPFIIRVLGVTDAYGLGVQFQLNPNCGNMLPRIVGLGGKASIDAPNSCKYQKEVFNLKELFRSEVVPYLQPDESSQLQALQTACSIFGRKTLNKMLRGQD